jgi:hypothetical protein
VIIGGPDREFIDELMIKLVDSISIRKEFVYGTDFLKKEEYENIINQERLDYSNPRVIIRAPVNHEDMVLENIENLNGWLIGLLKGNDIDAFFEKASRLRKRCPVSLFVILGASREIEAINLYGKERSKYEIDLESSILKKTMLQTESSLERMKRVLDKKIQASKSINGSILESLADLSQEEALIKENVFKKEILEFYQASRRGLAVLSRLNFFNQFQPVKIAHKTFFDAISYDSINTQRFLEFVQAEWNENFSELIDDSMLSKFGDHLDSLWG